MTNQPDLFPPTFTDLQYELAELRESHKKVHRALWHEIAELKKENVSLVSEIREINESLLYQTIDSLLSVNH